MAKPAAPRLVETGISVKTPGQGGDDQVVAIEGEQDQRRGQHHELRDHRRLGAVDRIEQGGEGQAHLQAHELAGQFDRGEQDAQGEAQGRADGDLLQQDQEAVAGHQGHLRHRRQDGGDGDGQHQGQGDTHAHRRGTVAQQGIEGQPGEDADQGKQEQGQQSIQVRGGKGEHQPTRVGMLPSRRMT
jgi:hypothetical protein